MSRRESAAHGSGRRRAGPGASERSCAGPPRSLRRVSRGRPEVCRGPRPRSALPEALHRVVYWHGDHLRTEALRVVPRARGRAAPHLPSRPEAPGAARDDAAAADRPRRPRPHRTPSPAILAPDDQRPRWRPGDRMEHLFEQRCDATPHHPAVEPENGPPLTFAELDARANRLARHLRARGIGAGDRVALMFDDAVWAYTAMLAALKAGAAFVPLDPGFPADRVGYIVSDAAASAVLTLGHLRGHLDEMQADVRVCRRPRCAARRAPVDAAHPGRTRPGHGRPAGLHHLHLRLDRPAQGRRDRARRASSTSSGSPPRSTASGSATGCTRA